MVSVVTEKLAPPFHFGARRILWNPEQLTGVSMHARSDVSKAAQPDTLYPEEAQQPIIALY